MEKVMALNYDDRKSIKEEILQVTDERYVRIEDCNNKQESINKKIASDDKRIEIILHDFDIIKKLMWAIASAGVGTLVSTLLGLIIK